MPDDVGGRVFFTDVGRSLEQEDEIRLSSVGVDIGSSTSHLVFSRLVLERLDSRYVVSERQIVHESEVLLTPYADDDTIDAARLGTFIARQYRLAGVDPDGIDTGALILTGVAVRRRNARAIAELFAGQAGRFVAVSAGDALETSLAALGSGAAALSIREGARVMNVDIGGGTAKIAICVDGEIVDRTAIDVGARVISFDPDGRVTRLEEAGRVFAADAGVPVTRGQLMGAGSHQQIVERMADSLFEAMGGRPLTDRTTKLLRLDPLQPGAPPDIVTFSGGVSEYLYGREQGRFGDLGPALAEAIKARVSAWGPRLERPVEGIRATVVGASQYTVQVSGSTIFVAPTGVLPLRHLPVITPDLPLGDEVVDRRAVADAVRAAVRAFDLQTEGQPIALAYRWDGSATFARLDAFCRGVADGLAALLGEKRPLVLVGEGDVGGLIGIHCHEEARLSNPIVSIDGIELKAFDFIDIGAVMPVSGTVPVVIKSLVFPASAAVGRPR